MFALLLLGGIIVLALILTPVFLIGIPGYIFYRLYSESPARHERLAREETEILYQHAKAGEVRLSDAEIEQALEQHWPPDLPFAMRVQLLEIGKALLAQEGLTPEVPPIPALCNTIEGARYRDMLAKLGQARNDRVMVLSALETLSLSLSPIAHAVPALESDVLVDVTQFVHPLPQAVQSVIAPFFRDDDYHHFKQLKDHLTQNLERTHRTNPIFPTEYKGDDVVGTYLAGTLLAELFKLRTPFEIPEKRRFEHTHIVAGSGHGKTQTLQYFIGKDIKDVARGQKSVVVIDSQGDLINTILKAKHLPPEQIVLIDPEDIDFPVSLNLFSVGLERLDGYSALDRERLINSIIELYDFVLGSLLSAGMTAKQSTLFRYVTRLMFHIPDATIHTFRELMEPGGSAAYQEHISKLEGTAKRFFETEFDGKEFTATKSQVLRRLYGVLENSTFERMFSNPQSKFDMFTELNAGKLILINTSKSLLKEQGTEVFGRFFVALLAQAAQERATLAETDRLPAMVYIDEAQDYFDANIGLILSQARKYRVGMVMSHQFLGQLGHGLQEGFEANTAIKMAGGVSARDARALAGQTGSAVDVILDQPTGTFATFIRGLTDRAVPLSIPAFTLEKGPQCSPDELAAIRQHSRSAYAEPRKPVADHSDTKENDTTDNVSKNDDEDPTKPSPEL